MKTGKSDPGSTGRAMATAEWNRIRLDIIKAERPGWNEEDMIVFKDVKDEQEHYAAQDKRFGERGGGSRATYMRLQARWRAMRGERQNGETLRSADRRRGLNGGNAEDHEAA
ncbi:MAG TPA: hypothetical protein VHP11_13375 [Tepidisphaeraceae bacterium]|nr:hypothetical protein [Tepidisphaeraceae bacterium]